LDPLLQVLIRKDQSGVFSHETKFWKGRKHMLWTICLILFVLWALGLATSYTLGGVIHVLLVLAVVVLVIQLIQGRRSIV
jgi:hypothetical protein